MAAFSDLSKKIIYRICSFLPLKDLHSFSLISTGLGHIASEQLFQRWLHFEALLTETASLLNKLKWIDEKRDGYMFDLLDELKCKIDNGFDVVAEDREKNIDFPVRIVIELELWKKMWSGYELLVHGVNTFNTRQPQKDASKEEELRFVIRYLDGSYGETHELLLRAYLKSTPTRNKLRPRGQ